MVRALSVTDLSDYDNHPLLVSLNDEQTGVHGFISIHRGGLKKPAFGATRFWKYASDAEALTDVLRLSRIMTYKSAMAGCGYGGAKAVLCIPDKPFNRSGLLMRYAEMVNYFSGSIVTGADVGINEKDVRLMRTKSRSFVGIKYDPVAFTLTGLTMSVKACFAEVFGSDEFSGRTFAIQGLGKTGVGLIDSIYKQAENIYVSDINSDRVKAVRVKYPKVKVVDPEDILKMKVDVFSPCALGNVLNMQLVKKISARIVCGSANCQLENSQAGDVLWRRGVLYAPDYVVNAGGLLAVVDEYENQSKNIKRVIERLDRIAVNLKDIISTAKKKNIPTSRVADEKAEKIFRSFK